MMMSGNIEMLSKREQDQFNLGLGCGLIMGTMFCVAIALIALNIYFWCF